MTKVKICGITNPKDALLAVEFGADALGLNFYEKSPRYLTRTVAIEIAGTVESRTRLVGVFVDADLSTIERIATELGLDAVQLHGDETPEYVESLKALIPASIIKAFRVTNDFQPATVLGYGVDGVLLDAYAVHGYGGTGVSFDWEIANSVKHYAPEFYLAGGLTPDNVADAICSVRPYAVDVASGVESTKGRKDPAKLKNFIRTAKST